MFTDKVVASRCPRPRPRPAIRKIFFRNGGEAEFISLPRICDHWHLAPSISLALYLPIVTVFFLIFFFFSVVCRPTGDHRHRQRTRIRWRRRRRRRLPRGQTRGGRSQLLPEPRNGGPRRSRHHHPHRIRCQRKIICAAQITQVGVTSTHAP